MEVETVSECGKCHMREVLDFCVAGKVGLYIMGVFLSRIGVTFLYDCVSYVSGLPG